MLNKIATQRGPRVAAVAFASLLILVATLFIKGTPIQASPASVNPAAPANAFFCTANEVAAFTNRVHVRCTVAAPGGIGFFTVSTADSAAASRFMSAITTAFVMGKQIIIFYDPVDLSGQAFGCLNADCRIATGAVVVGP